MKRILVMMLVCGVIASCGGKGGETQQEATQAAAEKKAVEMIPDELSEFEKMANAYIRPYFDEKATQTDLTIKPGERFDLYVFAEFNPLYPMSAAEFRLALPEGMSIESSANSDSTILSLGKPEEDFMIAFRCSTGPKMWLARYHCTSEPTFSGGTIETQKGAHLNYIGFTMCDGDATMITAQPGTAVIKIE